MKINSLVDSFNFAIGGLVHAFRTQRNMKIHFLMAFLVLVSSLFFDISKLELIILFFSISLVVAMELINTAIEVVIDMVCEEYHLGAKIAKNIAAAAVLIASINAVIVGYLIFRDELGTISFSLLNYIKEKPSHLTFINLGLLVIIITTLKAAVGKGSPLQGGMPSGHSAIAFSLATIIIVVTLDIIIATLVLLLAFLVVQSRLETRTHSFLEVFTGALVGILLTIIIFQFLGSL